MEDRWSRDLIAARCCWAVQRLPRAWRGRAHSAWASTTSPAPRPTVRAATGSAPRRAKHGGSLVFGVDAEESGFDPTTGPLRRGRGHVRPHRLRPPDHHHWPTGIGRPTWPQSVVPNAAYTSWTVTLRPNLVFHDGTPCNGAALLTNFAGPVQVAAHRRGPRARPWCRSPRPAPLAVTITFKDPWVPFPYYLAGGIGGQIAYVAAPSMLVEPQRDVAPGRHRPLRLQGVGPERPLHGHGQPQLLAQGHALPRPRSPTSPSPTSRPGPRRSSRARSTL